MRILWRFTGSKAARGQEKSGSMTATRSGSLECAGLKPHQLGFSSLLSLRMKDNCLYAFEVFRKKTDFLYF